MSDYELCHHGREIACLECIAEAKAEAAVQPPATPQEPTPLTLQACVECGDPIGWDASPDPTCCLCGDARRREAERTVASLACMLGWDNVPPREVLERSVNALKARVSTPSPEGQTWHEEWRGVVGYEGRYEVSCFGRVRKLGGPIVGQWRKSAGYYQVRLSEPRAVHLVHRLVAKAFIPNHENKPGVNHIDFDIINNAVANLEWCTQAENIQHSAKAGRMNRPEMRGKRPTVAAFTDEQVAAMRQQYAAGGETWSSLAAKFGVSKRTVGRILRREVYSYV